MDVDEDVAVACFCIAFAVSSANEDELGIVNNVDECR